MAHIEDRWYKTAVAADGKKQLVPKPGCGTGMRYRVRYIAPDGRERSESFPDKKKRDAQAFMVEVESAKLRGTYVDPSAGRLTFGVYAKAWLDHQTFDESTREVTERRLRRHINPYLGDYELGAIRPSHIRELDRKLQTAGRSGSFRAVVRANVATVLNAAVDDERITRNPCHARTVRPPRVARPRVVPWSAEQVFSIRNNLDDRYTVTVDLGAGCGLRQGEILALSADDINDNVLHIVRQLKIVGNRLVFALPKGRKTRDVPLPSSVARQIEEHARRHPPILATLPWDTPNGRRTTVRLLILGKTGVPLDRNTFNRGVWWPAAAAAGIQQERANGMHALRHFYASVLLDAGESIKALAAYLGHADPGFTLRTYTHLMPTSEERTRRAVDEILLPGLHS